LSSKVHSEELARKRELLALEEQRIALQEGLPHLYGWKWYTWAKAFFDSTCRVNLLTAANQVSKSSTMIRKCIHWATETSLWPSLWKRKPKQFWYFYPTAPLATSEFETKWQEFLPAGKYKDDPKYGWREVYKNKEIHAIYFNSGIIVYFHSYAQGATALQAGTIDAMFCDEEVPVALYDELQFRLSASEGYFHSVFTATLGQEFWRLVMEPEDHEEEKLPNAFKQTISLFQCKFYADGTPTHWTEEKIQDVIAKCSTDDEILKRVWGKFVRDKAGKKYPQFQIKRHMRPKHPLPKDWFIFGAADSGAGGKQNHPAACCFVAVRPDYRAGRVFLGWRGDGIITTSGDVVKKFVDLKKDHNLIMTNQFYDWADKDFQTIAVSMGESFAPADKSHETGETILNTLFKHDMLLIYEDEELHKLAAELAALRKDTPKNKAKDDFADALRYAVSQVPWDFSGINGIDVQIVTERPMNDTERQIHERRKSFEAEHAEEVQRIEDEIAEWNECYDA
jgi:hypothetical protein